MPKQGPKKTLLGWVNNALPKSSGLEVRDFGTSWRDGFAFLSLIDAIKTNVINIAEMKKYNNRYRLDTAFNIAEAELGIARLLDAEDVDVGSPDEKSIMTYVAQFLHKYPDVKNMNSKKKESMEQFEQEKIAFQKICCEADAKREDMNLKKLKHILDIVTTKKNEVDELNDVCEVLMEKSTCCMVRDRTIDLQKSYSGLLMNLQGLISQLQKNVMRPYRRGTIVD
ncbi:hypothetical protein quinque_012076 [Culex quinquefasciatus]